MDPYNPGDMNAGPQGMVPPAPGWMSMTPAALGWGQFGAGQAGTSGMEQSQRQAASMFGGSMVNSAFSGANATMSAVSFGSMTVAPLMAAYGRSAAVRGVGTAWSFADPFQWALSAGKVGWNIGRGAEVAGTSLTLGKGAAGLMVGGLAATGVGLAAQVALQAPLTAAQHVFTGASNSMLGQATLGSMSSATFGGHAATLGQGSQFGQDLHKLSQTTGSSTDELAQITKQLDQMKVFQHTRSVGEFRAKFKEVVGALKEIAHVTKQTLEEAAQTFGELKQQGFYTTADITAQAAKTAARSSASGISQGVLNQYGAAGAGMARQMGMRGKFGADYVSSQVTSMSEAYRGMTEQQRMVIDEHGGPEEMAANLAAKQMRHLSSARGRAMIAATLGANGAPDMGRLSGLLSGNMTTESIVEAASGRGLGVLMQAGNPRTREQYMQYAGMMDISMAMSQSKQLYGGTSVRGLNTMMGTLGYSRDETSTMLAQYAARPRTLQMEGNAQTLIMQEEEYRKGREKSNWYNQFNRSIEHYTNPYDKMGARLQSNLSTMYQNKVDDLTGHRLISFGSAEDYASARRSTGESGALGTEYVGGSLTGPTSQRDLLAKSAFAQQGSRGADGTYRSGGRSYAASDVVEVTKRDSKGNVSFITNDDIARNASTRSEAFATGKELAWLATGKGDTRGKHAAADYAVRVEATGYVEGSVMNRFGSLGQGAGLDGDRVLLRMSNPKARGMSDEDLNVFLIGQKTGGAASMSFDAYAKMRENNKTGFNEYQASVARTSREGGMNEHTMLRVYGEHAANAGDMSSEASREKLMGAIDKGMETGVTIGFGRSRVGTLLNRAQVAADRTGKHIADKVRASGDGSTLANIGIAVTDFLFGGGHGLMATAGGNDSAVSGITDRFMNALASGDTEEMDAAKRAAADKGLDTAKFDELLRLTPAAQKAKAAAYQAAGGSGLRDDHNANLARDQAHTREVAGIKLYKGRGGKSISQGSIDSLSGARGKGGRESAYRNIYRDILGDGELNSDEISDIIAVGGAEAGTMAGTLRDLAGDNKKKQAAALASLPGVSQEDYDKAMAGSGNRLDKALNLLGSKGLLDAGTLTREGGAATTVGGSQQAYVEANTNFVGAVSAFALMLKATFPNANFKGADTAVSNAADAVPGGGQ